MVKMSLVSKKNHDKHNTLQTRLVFQWGTSLLKEETGRIALSANSHSILIACLDHWTRPSPLRIRLTPATSKKMNSTLVRIHSIQVALNIKMSHEL